MTDPFSAVVILLLAVSYLLLVYGALAFASRWSKRRDIQREVQK